MARTNPAFLLIALAFISANCSAAGLPSIDGITSDGFRVAADLESPPYSVEIWKESVNRKLRAASAKRFDNEPCEFNEEVNHKGRVVRSFSCSKDAKSPLAGTKYLGRQVNGDCERGDPDFRYMCVAGCDKNKRAPRKMTQGHWEC